MANYLLVEIGDGVVGRAFNGDLTSGCVSDTDCKGTLECPGKCDPRKFCTFACPKLASDPCDPNPCGTGAVCEVAEGKALCSCPQGMTGDPLVECAQDIECMDDIECGDGLVCRNHKCEEAINPAIGCKPRRARC